MRADVDPAAVLSILGFLDHIGAGTVAVQGQEDRTALFKHLIGAAFIQADRRGFYGYPDGRTALPQLLEDLKEGR